MGRDDSRIRRVRQERNLGMSIITENMPAVFGLTGVIAGAAIAAASNLLLPFAEANQADAERLRQVRAESYDAAIAAQKALHNVIELWKDCEATVLTGVDPVSGEPVDSTTL